MIATIYSKDNCPFCVNAKNLLTSKGIEFKEKKLGVDLDKETMFEELGMEVRTVPQILIDNNYIGGYTDLVEYFKNQTQS